MQVRQNVQSLVRYDSLVFASVNFTLNRSSRLLPKTQKKTAQTFLLSLPLSLLFVNKSSAGDDKTGGGEDDYFEWGLETYFKCQLALPFGEET